MNRIGIDLGGTKIEGILLDDELNVLNRKRISTDREKGYSEILERIVLLITDLTFGIEDIYSIGICTPGAISLKSGRLKNSNTLCLIGQPIKEDLEDRLNKKVEMENDANCFALAETMMGASKGYNFVFGIIMGTGVGGGIVCNGIVHKGTNRIAGEWGHHCLIYNGRSCYCGKNGCTESYISGPALEKRWGDLTGNIQPLKEIITFLKENPEVKNGKLWKSEFLEYFGQGVSNVINILDPDAVVLGGGLSNIPFLYTEGMQSIKDHVFSDEFETKILKNKLGDSSGVFGAALLSGETE